MNKQILSFCNLIKNVIHHEQASCLEEQTDWSYMVSLAKKHNLLPICLEEAIKYPSYTSRSVYHQEVQEVMQIISAQIRRTEDFLQLYQSFADANIYPLVIKGLVCRQLYGEMCDHRPSGDEDLLIRPEEFSRVQAVLNSNGYLSDIKVEDGNRLEWIQEVSFTHPIKKLHIELHINLMGRENNARSRMTDYFANAFDCYREVVVNDVCVRTMNHQQHLVYLIFHAFKHFTGNGFGIRQMLDILLYQEQYGNEIDLRELRKTLSEYKVDMFWNDILHIGNSYFGFNLPVIREMNYSRELLIDVIECGIFGNITEVGFTAARATVMVTGDCLRDKRVNTMRMILRVLFPNKEYLLAHSPYLQNKPWLLPIAWIKRWGRFLAKCAKHNGNLVGESLKISRRRLKLMKKYNLL